MMGRGLTWACFVQVAVHVAPGLAMMLPGWPLWCFFATCNFGYMKMAKLRFELWRNLFVHLL